MQLQRTDREKWSEYLERRVLTEVNKYYPEYFDDAVYVQPLEVVNLTEIDPYSLVCCNAFKKASKGKRPAQSVYAVWDGKEVTVYEDDAEEPFIEVIGFLRAERQQDRLRYMATPVYVSMILAVVLTLTIVGLLAFKPPVPPELWTVYTAVIAFYFGRQGLTAMKRLKPKQ
jgi:hypothetical protein